MAGRGPAPKPVGDRRNKNQKQRGDWQELSSPVDVVPDLPKRGEGRGSWSARSRRAWGLWWSDPVSSQWGPADVDLVEHLADVYEEWIRKPTLGMAGEVRQLRDSLGLTPKGRQDRRWRIAEPEVVVDIEEARGGESAADRMEQLRQRSAAGA